MKTPLELEDLPHESLSSQYLLTDKEAMETGTTVFRIFYLLGRRARQVGRSFNITHERVKDGTLIKWEPASILTSSWK